MIHLLKVEYEIIPKRQRLTEDMNIFSNLINDNSFRESSNRFSHMRISFFKKFSHLFFETVHTLSEVSLNFWSADHVSQRSPSGVTCISFGLFGCC